MAGRVVVRAVVALAVAPIVAASTGWPNLRARVEAPAQVVAPAGVEATAGVHATAGVGTPAQADARALVEVRAAALPVHAVPPGGMVAAVPYGPEPFQLLDMHLPDRARFPGPVPVIVYLHSGGWVSGSRSNVADAALVQVQRGYAIASVDYRLATAGGTGTFPAVEYDVKRAIRFLKANAATWGLDPSRVIVMGESAGGHLAALTGASAGTIEPPVEGPLAAVDSSVIAVVDIVGITDLSTFVTTPHPWAAPLTGALLGCTTAASRSGCTATQLSEASVAPYLGPAAPPIFMAYGGADTLVVAATQGRQLARAWAVARGDDPHAVVYDLVARAGHNLSVAQLDMPALDQFLDRAASRQALATAHVVLYGDSLAWESRDAFANSLTGAGVGQVTTRTFGGTAICDWFDQMRADEVSLHPDAVVIEFSGNALTPCMKAASGVALTGPAYFAKYADDARQTLEIFAPHGTRVYFVGAPISRRGEAAHDPTTAQLHAIYEQAAASSPLGRYVDAGAAVTMHGTWTATLPCLGGEPCTGGRDASGTPVNYVRAPDGAHFCPGAPAAVRGVTGDCPVWSSGAWRFGTAMADPVSPELAWAKGAWANAATIEAAATHAAPTAATTRA